MSGKLTPEAPRSRYLYAVLVVVVIAAGLLWRSRLMPLPPVASKYGGDALWALMVFVGFGFLVPRSSTLQAALLAVIFSWAVEFSQIYHAPACHTAWSAGSWLPIRWAGSSGVCFRNCVGSCV